MQRVRGKEGRPAGRHASPQSASEDDVAPVDRRVGQEARGSVSVHASSMHCGCYTIIMLLTCRSVD